MREDLRSVVAHAADIPSSQYELTMKSDRIDAEKLARALRAGLVRGIYVRPKDNLDDRGVLRIRKTIQIQVGGYKTRIKHLLHSNGTAQDADEHQAQLIDHRGGSTPENPK